jgi:hypothetical protein
MPTCAQCGRQIDSLDPITVVKCNRLYLFCGMKCRNMGFVPEDVSLESKRGKVFKYIHPFCRRSDRERRSNKERRTTADPVKFWVDQRRSRSDRRSRAERRKQDLWNIDNQ